MSAFFVNAFLPLPSYIDKIIYRPKAWDMTTRAEFSPIVSHTIAFSFVLAHALSSRLMIY